MKFKRSLSLLLSAVMVAGCATVAVTAAESDSESVGYSNLPRNRGRTGEKHK